VRSPDHDCTFLREQARALGAGLRRSDDPALVATALTAHESSHESWLDLLARTEGDPALAERLATLYQFHGRLVESLDRGLDGWLNPRAAHEIRAVLADRLDECTEATVAALRRTAPVVVSL
jgi:hypothetical protein